MPFDVTKPLDDGYLAEAPAELRENFRALKDDKIVNAGKLNEHEAGNGDGNIPINNGTLNTNLNADKLDGKDAAEFASATHEHETATADKEGFMSSAHFTKLNGIAAGAEVNQNAFSNVKVGSSTLQADAKQDTLTLAAGNGITVTADTEGDKVTIAVTEGTFLPAASKATAAATAEKLTTPRTINGVAFDGSANVTIPIAPSDPPEINKQAGTFITDNCNPARAEIVKDLPKVAENVDWVVLQIAERNGNDATQFFFNSRNIYTRSDDLLPNSRSWNSDSWKQIADAKGLIAATAYYA